MMSDSSQPLIDAHKDHRRAWDDFFYVYPVISRRSRGVSIGINLNPDKICNFDCIYCEVDRTTAPRIRQVNLQILADELKALLTIWKTGALFEREPFASAPAEWRRLNDIAFSGDGEPTTCPVFLEAVRIADELRRTHATPETKLVLITDSACLDRPRVQEGLRLMQQGPHEIWAKLDAGTDAYYKTVNRTAIPLARILRNITETARWLPLIIQTLFLRVHGEPPTTAEIDAYCDRLAEIRTGGGQLLKLQLYTVARPTPESFATALTREELDRIAAHVHARTGLPFELAYGNA
jgi:wyosine [tRNA(Phe)-imidazoG37] synthetase (radical SAM superfamily)